MVICQHLTLVYDPVEQPSEYVPRWTCTKCGTHFTIQESTDEQGTDDTAHMR